MTREISRCSASHVVVRPASSTCWDDASYLAVTAEPELGDVVWTCDAPHDAVAEIAGHVAFHPDRVRVTVEPS